jgi:hypothetical protein
LRQSGDIDSKLIEIAFGAEGDVAPIHDAEHAFACGGVEGRRLRE